VTDVPPPDAALKRYGLAFLTNEWQWEADLTADTLEEAKAVAKRELEQLVRDEAPTLACVTILDGDRKLGVWDWVEGRSHWTAL